MNKKLLYYYKYLLLFYRMFGENYIISNNKINKLYDNIKNNNNYNIKSLEDKINYSWYIADQSQNLKELKKNLYSFYSCPLKLNAKNICFSDGDPKSNLMLIGEAPGIEEDLKGIPFVGKSGHLLNNMLNAIGLNRKMVYIINSIPWRPPNNRKPSLEELTIYHPFVNRHIELVNPKIILTLGNSATQSLIKSKEGIFKIRGIWKKYITKTGIKIPLLATLHPSYLLRQPSKKKLAWNDFLMLKNVL